MSDGLAMRVTAELLEKNEQLQRRVDSLHKVAWRLLRINAELRQQWERVPDGEHTVACGCGDPSHAATLHLFRVESDWYLALFDGDDFATIILPDGWQLVRSVVVAGEEL